MQYKTVKLKAFKLNLLDELKDMSSPEFFFIFAFFKPNETISEPKWKGRPLEIWINRVILYIYYSGIKISNIIYCNIECMIACVNWFLIIVV